MAATNERRTSTRGPGIAAAAAMAAVLFAVPAPAIAFELFGLKLFGSDEPDEPPSPDAIAYDVTTFTVVPEDSPLEKTVRGASTLWKDREEPAPSTPALLARARGDYASILAALYAAGHYGGTISIEVNGRQASDIPPDATLPDPVPVAIRVDPGPPFTFGRVDIENRPPPVPDDRTLPPTPEDLGLLPGEIARSTIVLRSESALVEGWRENSHPKARVAHRQATADHRNSLLDVSILMDPGRYAVFGPITVSGTQAMNPEFVAYYTGLKPGEPYDPDDLERARKQLQRLGVFQAMRFIEADEITPDGELPIDIQVADRKPRVIGFGANYSTIDGVGLEAFWTHRNLFGQGERLRVDGRVGGLDSNNITDFNYLGAVSFTKPGVFSPFADFNSRVFIDRENPDTYLARRVGANAGFTYRPTERLTLTAGANIEASRISQVPIGDGDFLLASIPAGITWDQSNSELDPTKGYRLIATAEPFYEFQFNNPGIISTLTGTTYLGFDADDRFVLALRASAGSIGGPPIEEIPANRQFYVGGGGSLRGFPYRGVGPLIINDEVIGGRSYFEGSVEMRARVTENIGVVPFLDVGNAFLDSFPDFSEELRYGAGIGLRYYTGIGPLRLDVATPVNPLPGDPRFAFYLGIGQAF